MLFSAQIMLSQAQSDELTSVVNLYTALGGGWK
jgi:outer membrane protein TolC